MTTPTRDTSKDLLRRHFEAVDDQNWEECAATIAPDIVFHQAGETHGGEDWLIDHYKDFYDTFPDASVSIDELLAEGDRAAVRITNTGTHEGDIPGIESSGEEIEFSSHVIARIDGGLLVELWVVAEQLRLMRQLGVVDTPK